MTGTSVRALRTGQIVDGSIAKYSWGCRCLQLPLKAAC